MSKSALDAASADTQKLIGQVLGNKYRIEAVIGRGGMGVVYQGQDLDLSRSVAVKVLHAAFSRHQIITRRFEREARSAAGLSHPNIVQVHDSGETKDGLRYLVMERLEGRELKAYLGEPMPPRIALDRATQILAGLAHAHAQGIVHRDLKPENVFVTQDDAGNEKIKLVDFGVAKIVDPAGDNGELADSTRPPREDSVALTQAGLIFGTPTYMSPEQATGTPVDARSDLYSFGVILYEMLTGRPPLYHKDPIRLIRMQVSVAPPPLDDCLSEDLRFFVHNLLAKERAERFENSGDALEVLRVLQLETPEELPPGPALSREAREAWIKNTQAGRDVLNQRDTSPGTDPNGWRRLNRRRLHARGQLGWSSVKRWCIEQPAKATAAGAAALGILFGLSLGVDGLFNEGAMSKRVFVSSKDIAKPSPGTSEIASIDRALLAKDFKGARKLIAPLLSLYPENGQLLWRQAKIKRGEQKHHRPDGRILGLYSAAMRSDPKLLDDPEYYREIYEILTHSAIRSKDAIEAAINYMDAHGHPFLLKLINKPVGTAREEKSAMPYRQRHRIIKQLKTKKTSESRIDQNIQLHRDLLQARGQHDPCGVFLNTLKAIEQMPKKEYFLDPLHEARTPRPNPKNPDSGQSDRCDLAKISLNLLRVSVEQTYGKGTQATPVTDASHGALKAPSPASHIKSTPSKPKRSGRRKLRRKSNSRKRRHKRTRGQSRSPGAGRNVAG